MHFTLSPDRPSIRIVTGVLLGLALLGATSSSAAADTPPGLSISIDDGATEVGSEQELVYSSELRNSGPVAIEATVVVTVPDYLEVTSVEGSDVEGTITGGMVAWPVSVQPGGTVTLVTLARVGVIPAKERWVTTIVSVYLGLAVDGDRGAPLIRSADSNRITGANDAAVRVDNSAVRSSADSSLTILLVSVGGVCVLLAAGSAFLLARRRRRHGGS